MNIRTAIIGPTGYTGYWLIELLLQHPNATINYLASARTELPIISTEYPKLTGRCDLACRPIDAEQIAAEADVAFVCLPHKAAMSYVPSLLAAGLRVVDLSADYRLKSADLYEQVYQTPHQDRDNLPQAVYGLAELNADAIRSAQLIANAGCYPTAAALALSPLIKAELIDPTNIIINAASGTTGAGRSAKQSLLFSEVNESYAAYACGTHRHQPEIEQTLTGLAPNGQSVQTLFVPHLLPIDRGILESIYTQPADGAGEVTQSQIDELFETTYADMPFVRYRQTFPNVKAVQGTNYCDIHCQVKSGHIVLFSAIDNMIKGASGQAVQNMNIMFDRPVTEGLGR